MGKRLALLVLLSFCGGIALASTLFPDVLYTYVARTGPVARQDFEDLARQVQAVQATLGVNLANIPTVFAPCTIYADDQGITARTIETATRMAQAVTLAEVYCDATGGTVYVTVSKDSGGTPTSLGGFTCTAAGVTISPGVALAAGDRLDYAYSNVAGAVTRTSVCPTLRPGS